MYKHIEIIYKTVKFVYKLDENTPGKVIKTYIKV